MNNELYQYSGAGLDNIYLINGYELKTTPFGQGVTIHNLDGLHRAIAYDLVQRLSYKWSGVELRFMRKELGFSQRLLGIFFRL